MALSTYLTCFSLRKTRELAENHLRSFAVGLMGLFWRVKDAKVTLTATVSYLRHPLLRRPVPRHAFKARLVGRTKFHISEVLPSRRSAKILPTVVGANPVSMVDVDRGPLARHDHPRDPVTRVAFLADLNARVAVFIRTRSGGLACLSPAYRRKIISILPRKSAGQWIVVQDCANEIDSEVVARSAPACQIRFSHSTLQKSFRLGVEGAFAALSRPPQLYAGVA